MITVVCHNIRSAYNIGSIIRTAECAGIKEIYFTGYSPSPKSEKVKKTSLGAENNIEWKYSKDISQVINALKKRNFFIISLETSKTAKILNAFDLSKEKNIALIVGNERRGLSKNIIERSDAVVEIPMFGRKESLNVSVAFGIAAYWMVLGF